MRLPLRGLLQRGHALAQSGDLVAADEALRQSLETARAAEETVALTLEAIARLAELRGVDGSAQARESSALLARLGVVSTPQVPL